MTALYELTAEYRQLALLEETATDEQVSELLAAIGGELRDKAVAVGKFVRNLESSAVAIEEAAKEMTRRAQVVRKRADGIKQYLLTNMQACDITRIESPWFVLNIRKNPPNVVVFDEAQVPPDYMVTPPASLPRPDKRALGDAMKEGEVIPGCKLESTVRLEIK